MRALAKEAFGIDWEEQLEDATIQELERKAERLWKKSGFDQFLNGAISALMAEAAPRCIKSALTIASRRLSELNNDVQLRSSAVNQDAGKIKAEIEYLNNDLDILKEKLNNLMSELTSIKKKLHENLKSKLKDLKLTANRSIDHYFLHEIQKRIEEAYPSTNLFERFFHIFGQLHIAIIKKLLTDIQIPFLSGFFIIPEALSHLFKYEVALINKNELEFKNKKEAEDFAERLVLEAKQIVETLLNKNINEIQREIHDHHKNSHETLRKNTTGVIENARKRLNQDFSVQLDLPALLSEDIEFSLEISSNDTIEEKEKFNFFKATVNFFKGFFDNNYTEYKEYRYTVSLPRTVKNFNNLTENKIEQIERDINQYLERDFEIRISNYVKELENYLKNYQYNLEQALKDKDSSLAKQDENKEAFKMLADEAKKLMEKRETISIKIKNQLS